MTCQDLGKRLHRRRRGSHGGLIWERLLPGARTGALTWSHGSGPQPKQVRPHWDERSFLDPSERAGQEKYQQTIPLMLDLSSTFSHSSPLGLQRKSAIINAVIVSLIKSIRKRGKRGPLVFFLVRQPTVRAATGPSIKVGTLERKGRPTAPPDLTWWPRPSNRDLDLDKECKLILQEPCTTITRDCAVGRSKWLLEGIFLPLLEGQQPSD